MTSLWMKDPPGELGSIVNMDRIHSLFSLIFKIMCNLWKIQFLFDLYPLELSTLSLRVIKCSRANIWLRVSLFICQIIWIKFRNLLLWVFIWVFLKNIIFYVSVLQIMSHKCVPYFTYVLLISLYLE